jgi:hypothetical protein
MLRWLDATPVGILAVAAIVLLAAPVRPMPHVIEKLIMLKNGTLTKPIDIFDLFFHILPTVLLIIKIVRDTTRS